MSRARDAVIGSGIVGLALALALARRDRQVTVFETDASPRGASARNFGTLWPIGQPAGPRRLLALESLALWRQVLRSAKAWWSSSGSTHLAYHEDELRVLREFAADASRDGFACSLLDPAETVERQSRIRSERLLGSLASPHEVQVNPRQLLVQLPQWLTERWGVRFERDTRVTSCSDGTVRSGRRTWKADHVWLATGSDLRTLYPEAFAALGLRRCKLQMLRTAPLSWRVDTILAAGLTLGHYESFAACPGIHALKARLQREWPVHVAYGVHVLVAQHDTGHLVIGDSHEYDDHVTPFDKPEIDKLVLGYLDTFLNIGPVPIVERWNGVYVKHPREPFCVTHPEPDTTAVSALGGHGMTLSFGLAEQTVGTMVGGAPAPFPEATR
jgi:FAD dependent oxidoreductase TIGR03364